MDRSSARIGATLAAIGPIVLCVGTVLHPMHEDPSDPRTAFPEYAADPNWVSSHLLQFLGMALILIALIVYANRLSRRVASVWLAVATAGCVASLAVSGALQAVDGIALKGALDVWTASAGAEKLMAFHAALAVRHIEVGLASMASLMTGLTLAAFAAAIPHAEMYSVASRITALLAGAGSIAGGIAIAYTGFSETTMNIGMPAQLVAMAWMYWVAVVLWEATRHESKAAA